MRPHRLALLIVAALALAGCPNSILWNTTEAGVETVLDRPLSTPTPVRR
jgi:hypothetical protein